MITRQSVSDAVQALLDRLQDSGAQQDYYRINHQPAEKIGGLFLEVERWLVEEAKIDVR